MFQAYSWRALRMALSHLAKSYILLSSGYVNYVIQMKFNDIIQQKCNILYMFSSTLPPPFSAKFVVFCIVVFHQCGFFYWPIQTFLNFKLIHATILPWEQFTAFAYLLLWYRQTCRVNLLLRQIFATILTQVPSQYK